MGNALVMGRADGEEVRFAGGRIDALILCEGEILRTSEPAVTRFGVAHVRRVLSDTMLRCVHVVFAPDVPRPLLLGLVVLENQLGRPLKVDYSELWGVAGTDFKAGPGACSCETDHGTRALGDVGLAVRANPPEKPPRLGLALEFPLVLPPGARRELAFAYAAPEPGEDPAILVRAWRGDVHGELVRTVRSWRLKLEDASDVLSAYRKEVQADAG